MLWMPCACCLAQSWSLPLWGEQRGWRSPAPLPGLQLSPCNPLPTLTQRLIPWLIRQAINTTLPQRPPRPCSHLMGQGHGPHSMGTRDYAPPVGQRMSLGGATAVGLAGPWAGLVLADFPLAALGTILCWAGWSLRHCCAWCKGIPRTHGDGETGNLGSRRSPISQLSIPPLPRPQ